MKNGDILRPDLYKKKKKIQIKYNKKHLVYLSSSTEKIRRSITSDKMSNKLSYKEIHSFIIFILHVYRCFIYILFI